MDEDADVVVIGAGMTGAAVAWRLATSGADVLCLDRGDWFDPASVPRDAPDFELRRRGPFHPNPNVRRAAADYPVDDADSPIKPMLANGVGGSSRFWAAHVPRFRPSDFRARSEDGVADDWPIAYDDLAPYYELNEQRIGTAHVRGDPVSPPRQHDGLPMPTIGVCGERFAAAFDRKGWHWWPVDLVVGEHAAKGEPCTHAGPCEIGCPARIRAGADRAYAAPARAAGARFLTGARALRLEVDGQDRVTAVVCATDAGPIRVRGRRFVLACNGMGTPRLLLLSASARFPDGLANRSGLVGRNLMLHPYGRIFGRFTDRLGSWAPGQTAGIISWQFFGTDAARGFVRGMKLQLTAGPGPMALALGSPSGRRLPWGVGHHAAFASLFDHVAGLTVCVEDLPEPENRIALSGTVFDADGAAAPRMIYRVSENSRRAIDFGLERAAEVLREAGAVETYPLKLQTESGFHLMGTARMGTDPARSVTDPFGRCHDVPNLFIADASVFVTASSANPTGTAQALALRMADAIVAER
jgi:choline dehydrogenase-like flavoprotein